MPDYTLFTNFDPSAACLGASGKRGICILVASLIQAIEISVTDRPLIEQLWLRLSTRKDGDLLLGCIYRSPYVDIACSISQLELSFEDLVFTGEEGMVKNLRYLPGLGSSDHVILRFDLVSFSHTKVDNRERKTHINYKDLTVTLSEVDWAHLQDLNLENGYGFLKTKMFESIDACSTKRRPKPYKNLYNDRTAWKLKKKKQHLWSTYTRSHDPLDYADLPAAGRNCENSPGSLGVISRRN